jgi:hypothetical protein
MRSILAIIAISMVAMVGLDAQAAFAASNGQLLCPLSADRNIGPVCDDNAGGFYALWYDNRASASGWYVSHRLADGSLAPGWSPTGDLVVGNSLNAGIATDHSGGVYVVWTVDSGDGHRVILMHLNGDHASAPGWEGGSHLLGDVSVPQDLLECGSDTRHGVGILTTTPVPPDQQALVFDIEPGGAPHSGWPANGLAVVTYPTDFASRGRVGSLVFGPNGAFLMRSLADYPASAGFDIQQIWFASGLEAHVVFSTSAPDFTGRFVTDGAGGALASLWSGLTHFKPSGDADWTVNSTFGYTLFNLTAASGGPDGILIGSVSYSSQSPTGARVQLKDGTLSPGWRTAGVSVDSLWSFGSPPWILPDGLGGGLFIVRSVRPERPTLAGKWLQANGTLGIGWSARGEDLTGDLAKPGNFSVVQTQAGQGWLVWEDTRSNPNATDIYFSHVGLDQPVAALASLVRAEAYRDRVELAWAVNSDAGGSLGLERHEGAGEWRPLAMLAPDGTGQVIFTDRAVVEGANYEYRLSAGGQVLATQSVTIPTAPALRLISSQTSSGALDVRLSLPSAAPSRLEAFDVQGRLLLRRDLGALAVGEHTVHADGIAASRGLVLLRLTQSGRSVTARAVVLH